MIEFTRSDEYPADLDRLWAVFGAPAYAVEKYRALGSDDVRVTRFDASPQSIVVELERRVAADRAALPPWARPLVASPQTLRHRSTWRRLDRATVAATLEIRPVALPVRARGVGRITASPVGSARATACMTVRWRVRSPVPLLGPRIETLWADRLRDALDADHAFTVHYLERHLR